MNFLSYFYEILFLSNFECFFIAYRNPDWLNFKNKNMKKYANYFEERKRFLLWEKNSQLIEAHNLRQKKGLETFKMELNFLSDLSYEEINSRFTGANISLSINNIKSNIQNESIKFVQVSSKLSVDYRNTILVGPIKNQGGACG
jgi:hypothetical protein